VLAVSVLSPPFLALSPSDPEVDAAVEVAEGPVVVAEAESEDVSLVPPLIPFTADVTIAIEEAPVVSELPCWASARGAVVRPKVKRVLRSIL
jgi:hypothetical protein